MQITLENIRKELGDILAKTDDSIDYSMRWAIEMLAIKHFGKVPYMNQFTDTVFDKIDVTNIDGYDEEDEIPAYKSDCTEEEYREKMQNIDIGKTLNNLLTKFPDAIQYKYKAVKNESMAIFHPTFFYFDGVFYMDRFGLPQVFIDCIVEKEEKPRIRWILRGSRGSTETKFMEITPKGSIEDNYNDDFYPIHEKITSIIRNDESGVIILHGNPGTGKTSYIRDLIATNMDVKFYWIDSSMFNYVDSSEFIEFIATCKNAVFILEDSEALLESRDNNKNPAMQSLLNISDGMLGDSLKLKFICTFNCDRKNVDSAILRKGRMKIKYEFGDLKKEKVEKLFEKLGIDKSLAKDMPLCDVYNFLDDNGNNKPERKRIGF